MGTHPIFESDFDCLTELEMSNNRKLLVASVLKFLQAEIESKKITPDQEESLNVASQCLAMAFNTTPEDAKDLPDLLELLSNACPDKMGKTEVSEEQKELAQNSKMREMHWSKSRNTRKPLKNIPKPSGAKNLPFSTAIGPPHTHLS